MLNSGRSICAASRQGQNGWSGTARAEQDGTGLIPQRCRRVITPEPGIRNSWNLGENLLF
jgi:hypothetical protein